MSAREGELQLLAELDPEQKASAGFVPDLVIVFPRPKAEEPGCCGSGPRKCNGSELDAIFDATLVNRDSNTNKVQKRSNDMGDELLETLYESSMHLQKMTKQGGFVDMKDVQDAIIMDLVNYLTLEHCHTLAFKSCDEDDLFLCVSLGDPSQTAQKDVVVTMAAEKATMKVQTTLDGDRANEKLGIKQTSKMGEELYIPFDGAYVESLNSIFNFPDLDQSGKNGWKAALIKQYPAELAGTEGSVLRSIDRTQLLVAKIEHFVDFEDLLDLAVISGYYIPHNAVKLEEFRSGKEMAEESSLYHKPHDAWANFKFWTIANALRWKLEDVQPIHEIRDYFGERVAFYFVWLSFTGRFITALVPVAFVFDVVYSFVQEEKVLKAFFYLLSSLLICIGSALYQKFWRRCENYYAALWDRERELVPIHHRPGYRGDDVPDPLNHKRITRIYPWWKAQVVHLLAIIITVILIGMTICVVTLIYYLESVLPFGEKYNKSAVSATFSLQVLIFQLMWHSIAGLLVDFANPRTEDDAKDLAVQFLFPFTFVSTYANLFYQAFFSGWGKVCLGSNCMGRMRPALYTVVLPVILMQFVSMLLPYAKYRYQLNDEMKQLRQRSPENPSAERSFLESQAKRPPFGTTELNSAMNVMITLLGYIVMLGFVAPGIAVVIALTFVLKIRIDAFKLCSVYQRTMPSKSGGAPGIGEWNNVLSLLLNFGRFSASAIVILNLEYFDLEDVWVTRLMNNYGDTVTDRQKVFQKLCLTFAFKELIVDMICFLIDSAVGDVSSETKLMKAKRRRVATTMDAKVSEKNAATRRASGDHNGVTTVSEEAAKTLELLQANDDSFVPLLDNKHKDWTNQMDMDYVPPSFGGDGGLFPDLVICFPRPQSDAQPGCFGAATTKYEKADVAAIFDEALVLRDRHAQEQGEQSASSYKMCTQIGMSAKKDVTLVDIQNALMSDMIDFLDKHNCTTMLFRSCDEDELFLCIGLGNPRMTAQHDPAIRVAARSANIMVQTTFNKELGLEKLDVLQDVGRFEEMHMMFHFGVLTTVSEALGFTLPKDAVSGDQTLIKQYSAEIAGTEGSILRTVDRIRLVMAKMAEFIDLEAAMGEGILSHYYTPHHTIKLQEFSSGKTLMEGSSPSYHEPHDPWSTFQLGILLCAPLRWKFEEVQPIHEIRDYFGERIAFYFAWLAFTARAFMVAVPVCLVFSILYTVLPERARGHELEAEAIVHILVSVLACLGTTLYQKFWKRWETYYAALWGIWKIDEYDARRPTYRGDRNPDPLNKNKTTKVYPAWKANAVFLVALIITAIFIAIVVGTVTLIYWLHIILPFPTKTNNSVISVLFSIQIVVVQLVWDFVSWQLVELANLRTDDEARDLAVQIMFPFSCVSSYANIAYHTFFTSWGEEPCVYDNCMKVMRPALFQVVLPALVMQVISMLRPYILYCWQLHEELKQLRIKKNLAEDAKIYRSFLEAQAKRPQFGSAELNSEINIMFVLVGYVVLFGCVAPGMTLAIAVVFMVKIRIDALKLCTVYQRVLPSRAVVTGIGEWDKVITWLRDFGRYTACAIPVFNLGYLNLPAEKAELVALLAGPHAKGMGIYGKIFCSFILKVFIDIVCGLVAFIDDEASTTKLMKAKRTKMAARLRAKTSVHNRNHLQREVDSAFQEKLAKHNECLHEKLEQREAGGSADIPKLDRNHEYWSVGMDTDFAPPFAGTTYFGR